jgi:hypothetical protein
MTVFMIPKILCKELNDAMARFGGEILMSQRNALVSLVENIYTKEKRRQGFS